MPIERCIFKENQASLGGAVMIYGNINPGLQGCTFSDNVAQYGNDTLTRPYKLQLRVYQFDEMLEYTTDLTLQTIISNTETVELFLEE